MELHTVLGTIGVALLLLAYLLNLLKVIKSEGLIYPLLNVVGAFLAAWSSYLLDFLPFIVLEGTWTVVSLIALIKQLLKATRIFLIPR